MKRLISLLTAIAAAVSCSHAPATWVDLSVRDFSGLEKSAFRPFAAGSVYDYDKADILAARTPGGGSVASALDDDSKTTSTNGTALFKNLISTWHTTGIESYCGSYKSVDQNGDSLYLSGRIIVPADHKVSRIMVVSHFTIGADKEAPSCDLTMESIYAARGVAVIEPDYIGYGITRDKVHPYLCSDLTAMNVTDMYWAALPFLKYIGCAPQFDDIFLLGFSQGGATTVAVMKYMERYFPAALPDGSANPLGIKIRLAMAGGGPYDVGATYDALVDADYSDYPCAIPMIIQGMKVGMKLDELDYEDFFQPNMLTHMDEWLNSKNFTMQDITELMGTKHLSDIMTEEAMNKATDTMTDLYRVMLQNSLTKNWTPQSPLYIFHSIDDNVVPFVNAANFQSEMALKGNISYNFGHYGNHVKACLRFFYATMTLMYEHGDIPYVI